jgi:hypothetical protein
MASVSPALASVDELEGTWTVARPQPGGLTELSISFRGTDGRMSAVASCSPRPCDLGESVAWIVVPPGRRDAIRDASGVTSAFDARDAQRQVIAQLNGRDRLQVITISSFKDGRPGTIATENFVRDEGRPGPGAGELAECTSVGALRIRFQGGAWALTSGGGVIARFDGPDGAGYARYIIQSQGMTTKCTIASAGFEYWTTANGGFPRGQVPGEYCTPIDARSIEVQRVRRNWRVTGGGQTLYETNDRDTAEEIAATLIDNRASAQCFVGEPGTGLTYYKR